MNEIKSWNHFLKQEFQKPCYQEIVDKVQEDSKSYAIFPKREDIFNAFKYCPLNKTSVIIIGQDPYHGEGQAHGLCFSVPESCYPPPSLKNIFKEIKSDLNLPNHNFPHGNLANWSRQGVLLLNSVLTVRSGQPASHKDFGWQQLTDSVILFLNQSTSPKVFLLWGTFAKSKKQLITNSQHLVLEAAHPSPLSAYNGFFGCKHFSKTNQFLMDNNLPVIEWANL